MNTITLLAPGPKVYTRVTKRTRFPIVTTTHSYRDNAHGAVGERVDTAQVVAIEEDA